MATRTLVWNEPGALSSSPVECPLVCGAGWGVNYYSHVTVPQACKARYFHAYMTTAGTGTCQIDIKKNGSTQATITITAGVTGKFTEEATEISYAQGDTATYTASSTNSVGECRRLACLLWVTSGNIKQQIVNLYSGVSNLNGYHPLYGGVAYQFPPTTDGIQGRAPMPCAATLSKFSYKVVANASSTSVTYSFRKNGANSGPSLTIGAGVTGTFTDTTTDALVEGDQVGIAESGATTGTTVGGILYEFELTGAESILIHGRYTTDSIHGDHVAFFNNLNSQATASVLAGSTPVDLILKRLSVTVTASSSTVTGKLDKLVGTFIETVSVTTPGSATGYYTDGGEDPIGPGENTLIDFAGAASVTTGAITAAVEVLPFFSSYNYARPNADVADGSWTRSDNGTNVNLYAVIDEAVLDTADYAKSSYNSSTVTPDTLEVGLGTISDPNYSYGQRVGFTIRRPAVSAATTCIVRLMQGATEIASWTITGLTTSFVSYEMTLRPSQTDAITDYSALRLQVEALKT